MALQRNSLYRWHYTKKTKKKKYDDEKIHFVRAVLLLLVAGGFVVSAGFSIYALFKTKEIVQHQGIYKKQRDYDCSPEQADAEVVTTGTRQTITPDFEILKSIASKLGPELNPYTDFSAVNPNERELPVGYRYTTVSSAQGNFLHDRFKNSLEVFANIPSDSNGRAGWFMEYFKIDSTKEYLLSVDYSLKDANAAIVVEEIASDGTKTYTDLTRLSQASTRTQKQVVFLPKSTTTNMRFFVQLLSTGSLSIYTESARAISDTKLDEAIISLSFDDGWKSVFDHGRPVLDKFGYKSTQFIIAESFRSILSGYMSLSEVKQLEKEGHEIGSHSLRHCNLARLKGDNGVYDLQVSKDTLETEFKKVRGLAYPYGAYTPSLKDAAKAVYGYQRTTDIGYSSLVSDRHELRAITITPDISLPEFQTIVDFAIQNKLWLDLVYHKIEPSTDPYSLSPETLTKQLEYIHTKKVRVMTVGDAVDKLRELQENRFGKATKK